MTDVAKDVFGNADLASGGALAPEQRTLKPAKRKRPLTNIEKRQSDITSLVMGVDVTGAIGQEDDATGITMGGKVPDPLVKKPKRKVGYVQMSKSANGDYQVVIADEPNGLVYEAFAKELQNRFGSELQFSNEPNLEATNVFDLLIHSEDDVELIPSAPHITVLDNSSLLIESEGIAFTFDSETDGFIDETPVYAVQKSEGYMIRVEGRDIAYIPECDEIPAWAEEAHLLFAKQEFQELEPGTVIYSTREISKNVNIDARTMSLNEARTLRGIPSPIIDAAISFLVDQQDYEYVIRKSYDEQRYTMGPMYIPNLLDAHNDWTDATELEKGVWGYVRTGDRTINLQHDPSIKAGEWVGILSWPDSFKTTLKLPGRGDMYYEFPPGTVYVGIIWEPFAWKLIKAGKIRGLSMGGKAPRIYADIETPANA